jgi:hypothetical protein
VNSQALLDQVALRDLVMRYCRGIDRRDFELVRSCYHDDATDDHGGMFTGSADDYVAWVAQALKVMECTVHSIGNSLFAVEGDYAEGEHYSYNYHRTRPPERHELVILGRYLDRYERRGGVWKFAHRKIVFDHGYMRPLDEAGFAVAGADAPHGSDTRNDPSFGFRLLAGLAERPV